MLVEFRKGFLLEGESTYTHKKFPWSKPVSERRNIYLFSSASGFCDESEVDQEIARLTAKALKEHSGWGEDFSGWQRVVPYDESVEIAKAKGWDVSHLPTGRIFIEYVHTWKMNKILERLTGEQFAQFCKDHNISVKDGDLNND